uniref:NADH dehydrogenase subunit 6 n=1 Tax=Desmaulus extinctorium TaxID=211681 RepID=UPI002551FC1E|nr:NADH dehydrogenase subunit 6 [Desmaulus extinctorium]WGH72834.1 NADH dehydrogenase subunit 6 [Desmaulus extinctorium]
MLSVVLISISISIMMLFPMMSQPLSLGLIIVVSSFMLCVVSGLSLSAWYAYVLFLIYVGAMLVMFVYVAALSPNILFSGKVSGGFILFFSVVLSVILMFFLFPDLVSLCSSDSFSKLKMMKSFSLQMTYNLMIPVFVGLSVVLLLNLISVVKICFYKNASMRFFKKD